MGVLCIDNEEDRWGLPYAPSLAKAQIWNNLAYPPATLVSCNAHVYAGSPRSFKVETDGPHSLVGKQRRLCVLRHRIENTPCGLDAPSKSRAIECFDHLVDGTGHAVKDSGNVCRVHEITIRA